METPQAYGLTCLLADEAMPLWQRGEQKLISARQLHAALEVPIDFTTWVKRKIGTHRFNHGTDYVRLGPAKHMLLICDEQTEEVKGGKRGGHNRTEYAFSLDAAKMVAMGTNNAVGDRIKRYFLRCEKVALLTLVVPEAKKVAGHVLAFQQVATSAAAQRFLARHGAHATIGYHRATYVAHAGMTGREIKQAGYRAGLRGPDLTNGRAVLRKLEPALACAVSLQDDMVSLGVPRAAAEQIAIASHDLFDAMLATGIHPAENAPRLRISRPRFAC